MNSNSLLITPKEFAEIFTKEDYYNLKECEVFYNIHIQKHFSIPKPLNNFNFEKEVQSFSIGSENIYRINLYYQTCNCGDYLKNNRQAYLRGDIRKLCKHLMDEYCNSFGTIGLSSIQKAFFENGYPVEDNLDEIFIESLKYPIFINRADINGWWRIFVSTNSATYKGYGYSTEEKRFSYNEKPHGYIRELREAIKVYSEKYNHSKKIVSNNSLRKKKTNENENIEPDGCVASITFILFILLLIYIFW